MKTLLAKDPNERIQTAHDVVLRLRDIAEETTRGPAAVAPTGRGRNRRAFGIVLGLGCALAGAAAWKTLWPPPASLSPARVVQLTTLRGVLWSPTFSPDGQQLAFQWQGEKRDNWDIYLKMVDSPEVRRLTTEATIDVWPSWSPDGRQIAFVRAPAEGESGRIHLVSPIGGSARKLSDLPVDGSLSWSPDGRWLAARRWRSAGETAPEAGGIHLVPTEGGEPRVLTWPKPPGDDNAPVFSPDGRRLAYVSCATGNEVPGGLAACDIFVLDLGRGFVPGAPPRQVTRLGISMSGLAWARDGASIVYSIWLATTVSPLFRVSVDTDRPPERIELAGFQAKAPAVAPSGHRLAFVQLHDDTDIYRLESGRSPEPILASSAAESGPDFSPDGRRIAFESTRAGEKGEIWLAAADGSNPVQLTRGPGRLQGSPSWSPDGRQVAFDSQAEDSHWDIWTVEVEGGAPRRLTHDPGDENVPSWSRDGRWVYFNSTRSGAREIWRIPVGGGTEERMTHGGAGLGAAESADGKSLLFWRVKEGPTPLVAHPLDGGPERTLVECVTGWNGSFAVRATGIYYRSCDAGGPIRVLDPALGRSRLIGPLADDRWWRFGVSPDGKTILYTRQTSRDPDLMMIDNFR